MWSKYFLANRDYKGVRCVGGGSFDQKGEEIKPAQAPFKCEQRSGSKYRELAAIEIAGSAGNQ